MTMEINRRRFVTMMAGMAGVGAFGVTPAWSAENDLLETIKQRGSIRVGTFSIVPESWIDIGTGEWNGISADFTRAIAKSIGVEVDAVMLVHASLPPALKANRVDVIAGLYRTAEREKVMAYNQHPFWYGMDVLISAKGSSIASYKDLSGKTLGVTRGSSQEVVAEELKRRYGLSEIRKFDAGDPMLLDLKAGRLDVALWWGYSVDYAISQNPSYDFSVVEYIAPEVVGSEKLPAQHYAFGQSGTSTLIAAFDKEIKRMRDSGEDREILARYGLTNPAYVTGMTG